MPAVFHTVCRFLIRRTSRIFGRLSSDVLAQIVPLPMASPMALFRVRRSSRTWTKWRIGSSLLMMEGLGSCLFMPPTGHSRVLSEFSPQPVPVGRFRPHWCTSAYGGHEDTGETLVLLHHGTWAVAFSIRVLSGRQVRWISSRRRRPPGLWSGRPGATVGADKYSSEYVTNGELKKVASGCSSFF